jgi:hypothetical protein
MSEAVRSQLRAILTRAADAEASRQRAVRDRDWTRVQAPKRNCASYGRRTANSSGKSPRSNP